MLNYDVIVAGGGIAGSITAKFLSKHGVKTLLIEKYETPREKPCSGIQFPYFEKIIDEKIPKERLCNIELNKVKLYLPDGKSYGSPFKMINFMRKPFDDWLNKVAQSYGTTFWDKTSIKDCVDKIDHVEVTIKRKEKESEEKLTCRYFVDATGLRPVIRKKLRPEDFNKKSNGATLNYYIDGDGNLDPNTLYQFWNLEWNDAMFAWVYMKTLDDGKNYWVVGTGCNDGKVKERQNKFYDYITEQFGLSGTIIKKEGYACNIDMYSKDRIWLGQGNIFMVGDAAGLVDQIRGVGMDAAALSGRILAKSIYTAIHNNTDAFAEYKKRMDTLVSQTRRNQNREINVFENNDELKDHIVNGMLKSGLGMYVQNLLNKVRPIEKMVLLPP